MDAPGYTVRSLRRRWTSILLAVLVAVAPGCSDRAPEMSRLDLDYGVPGFVLGEARYPAVRRQAESAAGRFDVIEFETFGRRFADQNVRLDPADTDLFGVTILEVRAGSIDGKVYGYLIRLEAAIATQHAFRDSLTDRYGPPASVSDSTIQIDGSVAVLTTYLWEGRRVILEYGMGRGITEVLVYDPLLRNVRQQVEEKISVAQADLNERIDTLAYVGDIDLRLTERTARRRYAYRGEPNAFTSGTYGRIAYEHAQDFFGIEGRSLFGRAMASATLHFSADTDSLVSLNVRFDNSQGLTVGFMDMLSILNRRLGRYAYSDTLHTRGGAYRRAAWYGQDFIVSLEEDRMPPDRPGRTDLCVVFERRLGSVR